MFSLPTVILTPEGNLPKGRLGAQEQGKAPPLTAQITFQGNPEVGTILHWGQIHSIFDSVSTGMGKDITDSQERLLRDLMSKKVKVIAGEEVSKTLPGIDPSMPDGDKKNALLGDRRNAFRGAFIDILFQGKSLDGPLNAAQRQALHQFGAVSIYAYLNPDVTVLRTIADPKKGEDANASRQAQAIAAIRTDYYKNKDFDKSKPGAKEVVLCIGSGDFINTMTCPKLDPKTDPKVIRVNYGEHYVALGVTLNTSKNPEELKAAAEKLSNMEVGDWKKLSEASKLLTFSKVTPNVPDLNLPTPEEFKEQLHDAAGDSKELNDMIDAAFQDKSGPFKELQPKEKALEARAGDPGITWKEWAEKDPAKDAPFVTIATVCEPHGPTQEEMVRQMKPDMYFPSQFNALRTVKAQLLALDKLRVIPANYQDQKDDNGKVIKTGKEVLRDVLIEKTKRDGSGVQSEEVLAEIKRRFDAKPPVPPFDKLK